MESFQQNAFYLLLWRALATGIVAIVLMATCFDVRAALLIGAHVALLFSLALIVTVKRRADDRVVWTAAWRMLKLEQQPAGVGGRRWASNCLRDISARFAAGAAAIAAVLSASALAIGAE